jgi:anti-sigma regulatory factor (Ser/Thr protein kinase)
MDNSYYHRFIADDRSYFSLIKKDIHKIAEDAGFISARLNEINIILAELTSNLQKYSTGGAEILTTISGTDENSFLEIICMDNGPGIANLSKVLEDGYSSSSTIGHGLGSIKRLSDEFDIFSLQGWGTILLVRVYKTKNRIAQKSKIKFGALVVPKQGEKVSGDGSYIIYNKKGFKVLVADGLGHGPDAAFAVQHAIHAFRICTESSAVENIRFINSSIKKTRGVVANVFIYDAMKKKWNICGVGNISTKLIGGILQKNYIPYNGIIGHNIPNSLNDVILDKDDYSQFIACSDGIRSRWDVVKFPTILKKDPVIIAAAIYKEYARQNDDMSVITCKIL